MPGKSSLCRADVTARLQTDAENLPLPRPKKSRRWFRHVRSLVASFALRPLPHTELSLGNIVTKYVWLKRKFCAATSICSGPPKILPVTAARCQSRPVPSYRQQRQQTDNLFLSFQTTVRCNRSVGHAVRELLHSRSMTSNPNFRMRSLITRCAVFHGIYKHVINISVRTIIRTGAISHSAQRRNANT